MKAGIIVPARGVNFVNFRTSMRAAASIAVLGFGQANRAQAHEDQQDIVVVAQPSERTSIDRTTYIVRDNAEARASSALDLLARVPPVDVLPSGQVRLIGRSGVTILIDGQEVQGATTMLHALQGSQIAQIEVITNPSAQFSARGTGGIINIITRRSFGSGLGGSMTASGGSFGSYNLKASPSWSQGKLSLNGSIGVSRNGSKSETDEVREGIGAGEGDRAERGKSRGHNGGPAVRLGATIALAPKQSLSVTASAQQFEGTTSARSEIVEDGNRSTERSSARNDGHFGQVMVQYRKDGSRPGEETSLSASRSWLGVDGRSSFLTVSAAGARSLFRLRSDQSFSDMVLKADHVRPRGGRRLSIGGQFQQSSEDSGMQWTFAAPPGDAATSQTELDGKWSEAAAYATYQFPWWGNMVLAGARIETRWYKIDQLGDDPQGGTRLFPSLHIERKLAKWLTANLSYSSRIAWPGLSHFDPRLRFSDPTTARSGNPLLRPERTGSFELKLTARAGNHQADLTTYFQQTRDLRSSLVELEDGVLVSRPVNLGTRRSLGANLNVRGPLAKGLSYAVTADLARETIGDAGLANVDDEGTRYGASLQIEYGDGIEGRAGADRLRLTGRYTGAIETGLARTSPALSADASWSHAVTHRLSAVLTASHAFRSPKMVSFGEDVVFRTLSRASGPQINVALTYGLGASGK